MRAGSTGSQLVFPSGLDEQAPFGLASQVNVAGQSLFELQATGSSRQVFTGVAGQPQSGAATSSDSGVPPSPGGAGSAAPPSAAGTGSKPGSLSLPPPALGALPPPEPFEPALQPQDSGSQLKPGPQSLAVSQGGT